MTFIIYITIISFLLSILKSLIADPRPFWISAPRGNVAAWEWVCYAEYGNPSGIDIFIVSYIIKFIYFF